MSRKRSRETPKGNPSDELSPEDRDGLQRAVEKLGDDLVYRLFATIQQERGRVKNVVKKKKLKKREK